MAFFGYGSRQAGYDDGAQEQAERRQAWEQMKREGALPLLALRFGLGMMADSETQGLGRAAGRAGLSALDDCRNIMEARRRQADARQKREDELRQQAVRNDLAERRLDLDRERLAWDMARNGASAPGAQAALPFPAMGAAASAGAGTGRPGPEGKTDAKSRAGAEQAAPAASAPGISLMGGGGAGIPGHPEGASADLERHIRDYAAWVRGGMQGPEPTRPANTGGNTKT